MQWLSVLAIALAAYLLFQFGLNRIPYPSSP